MGADRCAELSPAEGAGEDPATLTSSSPPGCAKERLTPFERMERGHTPSNVSVSKATGGGAVDKRTSGTRSGLGLQDRVRLGWGLGRVGRFCLCFFFFSDSLGE